MEEEDNLFDYTKAASRFIRKFQIKPVPRDDYLKPRHNSLPKFLPKMLLPGSALNDHINSDFRLSQNKPTASKFTSSQEYTVEANISDQSQSLHNVFDETLFDRNISPLLSNKGHSRVTTGRDLLFSSPPTKRAAIQHHESSTVEPLSFHTTKINDYEFFKPTSVRNGPNNQSLVVNLSDESFIKFSPPITSTPHRRTEFTENANNISPVANDKKKKFCKILDMSAKNVLDLRYPHLEKKFLQQIKNEIFYWNQYRKFYRIEENVYETPKRSAKNTCNNQEKKIAHIRSEERKETQAFGYRFDKHPDILSNEEHLERYLRDSVTVANMEKRLELKHDDFLMDMTRFTECTPRHVQPSTYAPASESIKPAYRLSGESGNEKRKLSTEALFYIPMDIIPMQTRAINESLFCRTHRHAKPSNFRAVPEIEGSTVPLFKYPHTPFHLECVEEDRDFKSSFLDCKDVKNPGPKMTATTDTFSNFDFDFNQSEFQFDPMENVAKNPPGLLFSERHEKSDVENFEDLYRNFNGNGSLRMHNLPFLRSSSFETSAKNFSGQNTFLRCDRKGNTNLWDYVPNTRSFIRGSYPRSSEKSSTFLDFEKCYRSRNTNVNHQRQNRPYLRSVINPEPSTTSNVVKDYAKWNSGTDFDISKNLQL